LYCYFASELSPPHPTSNKHTLAGEGGGDREERLSNFCHYLTSMEGKHVVDLGSMLANLKKMALAPKKKFHASLFLLLQNTLAMCSDLAQEITIATMKIEVLEASNASKGDILAAERKKMTQALSDIARLEKKAELMETASVAIMTRLEAMDSKAKAKAEDDTPKVARSASDAFKCIECGMETGHLGSCRFVGAGSIVGVEYGDEEYDDEDDEVECMINER
jgi:hypothetical protein